MIWNSAHFRVCSETCTNLISFCTFLTCSPVLGGCTTAVHATLTHNLGTRNGEKKGIKAFTFSTSPHDRDFLWKFFTRRGLTHERGHRRRCRRRRCRRRRCSRRRQGPQAGYASCPLVTQDGKTTHVRYRTLFL